MPIQTVTREIDGTTFHITEFAVMRALPLKVRLGVILAPALGEVLAAFDGKVPEKGMDMDVASLAPAINALAKGLKPDEFASICRDLFTATSAIVDGKRIDVVGTDAAMDAVFGGRIETMYRAIWAVLDVNRFFGLGSIGKAIGSKVKSTDASKLPAAS